VQEHEEKRGLVGHFVRSVGESTRHNALAYGYSLALSGAFGVLNLEDRTTVAGVILFGFGGALPFSIANPLVTHGFTTRVEGEPPIVLSLGTSLGFVSVAAAIGLAAFVGWLLGGWVAWTVGGFVASSGYLLLTAVELVLARALRALLGREHLQER
jgi:MFS family permease